MTGRSGSARSWRRRQPDIPPADLYVQQLREQLAAGNVPAWEPEYLALRPRRFRCDFAWPAHQVAVEIDGGTWSGGRHTQPAGFQRDCIKTNLLQLAGWIVLRFTADMVRDGLAIADTQQALALRAPTTQDGPR